MIRKCLVIVPLALASAGCLGWDDGSGRGPYVDYGELPECTPARGYVFTMTHEYAHIQREAEGPEGEGGPYAEYILTVPIDILLLPLRLVGSILTWPFTGFSPAAPAS